MSPVPSQTSERLLRLPQVQARVNMSRSWMYDQVKKKNFPAPVQIGPNSVGWRERDIDAWLEQRIGASQSHGQ
jgi:prophage regulatory protein